MKAAGVAGGKSRRIKAAAKNGYVGCTLGCNLRNNRSVKTGLFSSARLD